MASRYRPRTISWDGRSTRTFPDGGVEKWAYSAAGVSLHTNQLGKITKYGYDVVDRGDEREQRFETLGRAVVVDLDP
jgi:hypothetical protein